jgi:hypothetical protein
MQLPLIDYRRLRRGNLFSEEFRHLWLLAYWPIFGLLFLLVERVWTDRAFVAIHCALDDKIPFCEFFLIPYLFWFVYLAGMHLYTLLWDRDAFVLMMRFIIVTYSIAILAYFLFPSEQNLRPAVFARSNAFTSFVTAFYRFDTNTNVCPSIHVIGSVAVLFAAWHIRRFSTPGWRIFFAVSCILICASTVFLKQHSILDVLAALPVCAVGWFVASRRPSGAERRSAVWKS